MKICHGLGKKIAASGERISWALLEKLPHLFLPQHGQESTLLPKILF